MDDVLCVVLISTDGIALACRAKADDRNRCILKKNSMVMVHLKAVSLMKMNKEIKLYLLTSSF